MPFGRMSSTPLIGDTSLHVANHYTMQTEITKGEQIIYTVNRFSSFGRVEGTFTSNT